MSELVVAILGVPAAGALGALLRNEVTARAAARWSGGRARGTALVNIGGTIILALLVGLASDDRISAEVLLVAGVGFSGALTTFSTWVVEALRAGIDGERPLTAIVGLELLAQLAVGIGVAFVVLSAV